MATLEVVYTWDDGREEVRYRRPEDSEDAAKFKKEVESLQHKWGHKCPYSYRVVKEDYY